MAFEAPPVHDVDIDRHGGDGIPTGPIPKPGLSSSFELDPAVVEALPILGTRVIAAHNYGMSLWGQTARIDVELSSEKRTYFLKTVSLDGIGRLMMEGEFESLRALNTVLPSLAPYPYAWGTFKQKAPSGSDVYFLLTEYREVGEQPPNPVSFTARLAEMHKKSISPTGKFGFHVTTCHAKLPQVTEWEDSWAVLYKKQLANMIKMDYQKHGDWPEFSRVCDLTLEKVIPRLLDPLQSGGRSIKPCLVHGDLWDENTATDMDTDEPFIFDAGSFYAHNEYELGNWRAARHRLSDKSYVRSYKRHFPVSEPEDEWDDRNLLYSLRYDLGTAILIPGCNQRQVVMDNMTLLCKKFCPKDLIAAQGGGLRPGLRNAVDDDDLEEEEEEDEES